MRPRDFLALVLVCTAWGMNFVVTKWLVAGDGTPEGYAGLPPFFAAGLRFGLVALILAPLLRPVPKQLGEIVLIGITFGALHFGLLNWGLLTATPSATAVTIQLGVPFMTILSVFLLGETVGPLRIVGIALAFLGVALIALDPAEAEVSQGLIFVACGAFMGALGGILVKRRKEPIGAVRLQAWIGVVAAPPLIFISGLTETGQMLGLMSGGWPLVGAFAFVTLIVSIAAHGGYVVILRRYDASLVSPMTLMAPLLGMVFGVLITGDPVTPRLLIGGALAISGVALIAVFTGRRATGVVGAPSVTGDGAKKAGSETKSAPEEAA